MRHSILQIAAYTLITGLLGISNLQAQDTTKLTLQHAIELGIKNSKELKGNAARVAEAVAQTREAKDRQLPDASISGSYLYFPVQPNVNLKINTGGSGGSGGGSSIPKVDQVLYGTVGVSETLFAGGKIRYGIESAKYLEQATKLNADNNRQEVVINTINAFANLYKAKKAVELVKENLAQSQQRVTDFTNLEKNGVIARNDLLKVELESSNIELALLDAENNYKLASVNMNLMLGLPEQTSLDPDSTSLVQANPDSIKTIDQYETSAIQTRKEIAALALQKKAADLGIKSAKADYYPNLAISTAYIGVDVPGLLTVTNAWDVGAALKYNISSLWKTKAAVHEAEARSLEIEANTEALNDKIRLQINQAYENYLLSQKKIEVLAKAVAQSTENYRITKNKYDNSLETTTNLLDADVASLQAQLNYTNAKADAVVSYNILLQTAGLLNN
jgi:outer membrane protein